MDLIKHALSAIEKAERLESEAVPECLAIDGMSSARVRHFLNNITAMDGCRYLEIGCWKGSTLISALCKRPDVTHWVIENWSEFGGPREELLTNFKNIIGGKPNLIEENCLYFDIAKYDISGVNVFFYDGAHDFGSQSRAIQHFAPVLAKESILIVDDWDFPWVESATMGAIMGLGLKLKFSIALPSTTLNDVDGWWNGLFVSVVRKC